MNRAPIVLFVYNRIEHLRKTIDALKLNDGAKESDLYIFSDGPKENSLKEVEEVRTFIKNIEGFKKVEIVEFEINKGLAESITFGVTKIVNEYGKVIVLEDDIITSTTFLSYMNSALELYVEDEKVMHISGYMFPVSDANSLPETFFIQPTSCWGWATWDRSWKYFIRDADHWLVRFNKNHTYEFNIKNSHDFKLHLYLNKVGKMKTWAIFWYASVYFNNGLSLHPKISYCQNIGHDGTGTNCDNNNIFKTTLSINTNFEKIEIVKSELATNKLADFYLKNQISFLQKIKNKLKKLMR